MPMSIEKFAKGRVSLSPKIIQLLELKDGDGFWADVSGNEISLTKVDPQEANEK